MISKILFSKFSKIFYTLIITFVFMDIIFSNTIIKNIIKKDCFKYIRYSANEKKYYSYELEKNCKAYETKKTVKTYSVFTDLNGYRVSSVNKIKETKNNNSIVFLGDSFTYGFGLKYEDSVVGYLEDKNKNYNFFNLAVPGYSPLILKYKLKKLLESGIRPKKIFYLMDLTDVHDESNRWIQNKDFEYPVILDETIHKEIKKIFDYKNNFKMTRLLIYNLNKLFRNFRKDIYQKKFEENDMFIGKTHWGSFTHTSYEELDKSIWLQNDFKVGIKNIMINVKSISQMAKKVNSEFYIVIYPWPETLEYGEKYFNWQQFSSELCQYADCTKLVNAFPAINKIKNKYTYWKKEIYLLQDVHFNAYGNHILAETIYKEAF